MQKPTHHQPLTSSQARTLPEHLDGHSSRYHLWRSEQLQQQAQLQQFQPGFHPLDDQINSAHNRAQFETMCQQVQDSGFTLYEWTTNSDNARARECALHQYLGLIDADTGVISGTDNLSLLEDKTGTRTSRFIPYSNRAMNWHTDGYYNAVDQQVRCFSLYCIEQAASGGALTLMKNELLLIALYDTNPEWVTELTHPQAMLLPGNTDDEGHHRPDRSAPVLSAFSDGTLNTRFTTRTRNIHWHSAAVKAAAESATRLITDSTHWHTQVRLEQNQGIITRNMLHRREAFIDEQPQARRQILRGRYSSLPQVEAHQPQSS